MSRESKLINQEKTPPSTIKECLRRIVTSENYNDVGINLYQIICHSDQEPYNEWVQTWLIKCISECFKDDPVKMDIMFAYFALLPNFTLHTSIKYRLMLYVEISGYLGRYPIKSKRSLEEIKNDISTEGKNSDLRSIEGKITHMQRECLSTLEEYITGIESPKNHIASLDNYGKLEIKKGKKIYCPFSVELRVPISDTSLSVSAIESTEDDVGIEEAQQQSSILDGYDKLEDDPSDAETTSAEYVTEMDDDTESSGNEKKLSPKSEGGSGTKSDNVDYSKMHGKYDDRRSGKSKNRKKAFLSFIRANRGTTKNTFSLITINKTENTKRGRLRCITLVILAGILVACFVPIRAYFGGFFEKDTLIDNIHIVNKEISLFPGTKEKIKVSVYPNNANLDLLEYFSQNPNVAYIEDAGDAYNVVAPDGWLVDAPHNTTISVQFRTETDTAFVTIMEPISPPLNNIGNMIGAGANLTTDQGLRTNLGG